MNLFAVLPILANQATLSFESVTIPDASVANCILNINKDSSMVEANFYSFDVIYRSKASLDKAIRSCY